MKISASVLDADWAAIWEDLEPLLKAGLEIVHLDVGDGRFVPNLSFGPKLATDLRRRTDVPMEVHLMVSDPLSQMDFLLGGNFTVYFHPEAERAPFKAIDKARKRGWKIGIALNPGTTESSIAYILPHVDSVLVMTVEPGFGGQAMITSVLEKVRALKGIRDHLSLGYSIAVDGGIKKDNLLEVEKAGADIAVVGSAIFSDADPVSAFKKLRSALGHPALR